MNGEDKVKKIIMIVGVITWIVGLIVVLKYNQLLSDNGIDTGIVSLFFPFSLTMLWFFFSMGIYRLMSQTNWKFTIRIAIVETVTVSIILSSYFVMILIWKSHMQLIGLICGILSLLLALIAYLLLVGNKETLANMLMTIFSVFFSLWLSGVSSLVYHYLSPNSTFDSKVLSFMVFTTPGLLVVSIIFMFEALRDSR